MAVIIFWTTKELILIFYDRVISRPLRVDPTGPSRKRRQTLNEDLLPTLERRGRTTDNPVSHTHLQKLITGTETPSHRPKHTDNSCTEMGTDVQNRTGTDKMDTRTHTHTQN